MCIDIKKMKAREGQFRHGQGMGNRHFNNNALKIFILGIQISLRLMYPFDTIHTWMYMYVSGSNPL